MTMIRLLVFSLLLCCTSAQARSSFGDNVAVDPEAPKQAARAATVGLPSSTQVGNVGLSSVEVAQMVETNPDTVQASLWHPSTDDPETEKKIYNHITHRYRRVSNDDAKRIASSIVTSAKEQFVDPYLVTAVIERESEFNKNAVSHHGAQGLGQLMPMNHKHLGITDAFDIDQNVKGTTVYLRHLMDSWAEVPEKSLELTLASYAEGPNAVRHQNRTWRGKTNQYINDIVGIYQRFIGTNELQAQTTE